MQKQTITCYWQSGIWLRLKAGKGKSWHNVQFNSQGQAMAYINAIAAPANTPNQRCEGWLLQNGVTFHRFVINVPQQVNQLVHNFIK